MTIQKMAGRAMLAVGVAGLATAGCGTAATLGTVAPGTTTGAANVGVAAARGAQPLSSQDRVFMNQASQINLAEVALGTYMREHAATTTAKNLGAVYARDHTAAQARLRALAAHLRMTVPTTPGVQLGSLVARIEAAHGRSRDVAFVRASVSGHRAAIAIFRKEEHAGSNPAVRAYAAGYLPMLETHLRLAEHAESVLRRH